MALWLCRIPLQIQKNLQTNNFRKTFQMCTQCAIPHATCHMHHLVLKTNKMLSIRRTTKTFIHRNGREASKLENFNELNCCKSLQRYSLSIETFNWYFFVVTIAMDEMINVIPFKMLTVNCKFNKKPLNHFEWMSSSTNVH